MSRQAQDPQAALRLKLRHLINASRLPQEEFAAFVLGVNEVTVYRYLKHGKIPQSKASFIRRVEHISRSGDLVQITVRTIAERGRWRIMNLKRERRERGEIVNTVDMLTHTPPSPSTPFADPLARLNHEYSNWMRSQRIREYATAIREASMNVILPNSDLGRWLTWIEQYANAIDPLYPFPGQEVAK